MTNEMVERIARKLYEHEQRMTPTEIGGEEQWSEYFAWDGPHFKGQNIYRAQARIAIEAMRDPTEAMIVASGHDAMDGDTKVEFALAYEKMIDAALAEEGSPAMSVSTP